MSIATTTLGPMGFGRPATPAERAAFRAELRETPYARAARLLACRERWRLVRRAERAEWWGLAACDPRFKAEMRALGKQLRKDIAEIDRKRARKEAERA